MDEGKLLSEEEPPLVLPSRIQTERRRSFFYHECEVQPVVYHFRYLLMRFNGLSGRGSRVVLGFASAAASSGRGYAPLVAPRSQRQTLLVKVGRRAWLPQSSILFLAGDARKSIWRPSRRLLLRRDVCLPWSLHTVRKGVGRTDYQAPWSHEQAASLHCRG